MEQESDYDREYIVEYPAIIRVPIRAFNRDEALGGAPGYLPSYFPNDPTTIETEDGFRIEVEVLSHVKGVKVFRVTPDGLKEVGDA
jgi:hypothetical protein